MRSRIVVPFLTAAAFAAAACNTDRPDLSRKAIKTYIPPLHSAAGEYDAAQFKADLAECRKHGLIKAETEGPWAMPTYAAHQILGACMTGRGHYIDEWRGPKAVPLLPNAL